MRGSPQPKEPARPRSPVTASLPIGVSALPWSRKRYPARLPCDLAVKWFSVSPAASDKEKAHPPLGRLSDRRGAVASLRCVPGQEGALYFPHHLRKKQAPRWSHHCHCLTAPLAAGLWLFGRGGQPCPRSAPGLLRQEHPCLGLRGSPSRAACSVRFGALVTGSHQEGR